MTEKFPGDDPETDVLSEDNDSAEEGSDSKNTLPPNYGALLKVAVDGFKKGEEAAKDEKKKSVRLRQNPTILPTYESLAEVTRQQVLDDLKRKEEDADVEEVSDGNKEEKVIIPLDQLRKQMENKE